MHLYDCFDRVLAEEVPKDKSAWHEWACIKAYLTEQPKVECREVYKELFGKESLELEKAPKWLIILACMWKGAEKGHKRKGLILSGADKQSLALLSKLDESALLINKNLKAHIRTGNGDILS